MNNHIAVLKIHVNSQASLDPKQDGECKVFKVMCSGWGIETKTVREDGLEARMLVLNATLSVEGARLLMYELMDWLAKEVSDGTG